MKSKSGLYLLFGALVIFVVIVTEKSKIQNTPTTTPLPTVTSEAAVAFQNIQSLGPAF